ncbi:threonine-phosphate decarboxylase CobD [Paenibacillus sp. GCM10027627]|uniref:threonine-phosphate decarboxylase CobD n=1 Tax=unclassified Paenibacillus TaxID=185978 RepID=UPI00362E9E36
MLERFGHGGDLQTAEETYGFMKSDFLDYSSNMNPLGPPPAVRETLIHYADHIERYPDPIARGLRRKLAERYSVDSSSLLAGNGGAELIDLAVRWLKPTRVVTAAPCFSEYGDAVRKIGAELLEVPLKASSGFQIDEEWMNEAMKYGGSALYILGSPNNPTGRLVHPDQIRRLLEAGAFVVLDEAFIDFVAEAERYSLIQEASAHKRLLVIRSMTKFYAIPGIRLGFIAAHPDSISELSRLQVPWSVNSLAQQIGEAVLDDREFEEKSLTWLHQERPKLANSLSSLGFNVYESSANYLLLQMQDAMGFSAGELQEAMGRRGFLIRNASLFAGLNERYIRVAVKLEEQNRQFISSLQACLLEKRGR